jgi:hypothetical protein
MDQESNITLRDLYPAFTEEQLAEAEATFRRYIAVMVRIHERVRAEQGPDAATRLANGDLTGLRGSANVPVERSNLTPTHHEIQ